MSPALMLFGGAAALTLLWLLAFILFWILADLGRDFMTWLDDRQAGRR